MMETDPRIVAARDLVAQAARWLVLARYQSRPDAPVFSAGISTYADMLDPASTDQRRCAAAASVLCSIDHVVSHDIWQYRKMAARKARVGLEHNEWQTTLRGAALETVRDMLSKALRLYGSQDPARGSPPTL